jgi:hypothetical protein
MSSELTPQAVLADLFDSDDFPDQIADPDVAAQIVVQDCAMQAFRSFSQVLRTLPDGRGVLRCCLPLLLPN